MCSAIQSPFLQVSLSGSQFVFVGRTRLLMTCSLRALVRVANAKKKTTFFILPVTFVKGCTEVVAWCLKEHTLIYIYTSAIGSWKETYFNEYDIRGKFIVINLQQ